MIYSAQMQSDEAVLGRRPLAAAPCGAVRVLAVEAVQASVAREGARSVRGDE